MPFQYALNCSTIRPAALLDKIRIAGETGYQGIELWHDDLDAHLKSGGSLDDVRKTLSDHGLAVPTTIYLKGWFETTGETHRQELAECRRRMEQAAALGAEFVIAGPPGGTADHTLGGKHYAELLALGREIGVRPAMEFLGFVEDINTIEDALEIVHLANDPTGTVVLDPFHIFRGGGELDGILKLSAAQVAVCHFNDAPASPPRQEQHDKDRVYPGEGHLDLRRMLRSLDQIGYSRWLSLELFRPDLWAQDPREVARIGLEKMRGVAETL